MSDETTTENKINFQDARHGVFVGIRRDRSGSEQLGVTYTSFNLYDIRLYFDKENKLISQYAITDTGDRVKRNHDEMLALPEYGSWKYVELRLGEIVPLPVSSPAKMEIVWKSGMFADVSCKERIAQLYAEGKTPHEVYDIIESEGGIIGYVDLPAVKNG